jgi:hypothetical protein
MAVQTTTPTRPNGRLRRKNGYGRKTPIVRTTRPTGPNVIAPDRQRDSLNRSAAGFGAVGRKAPLAASNGASAAAKTPLAGAVVGIGRRQSPHQAAPGRTIAAQPGQRAVDVSEAIVISIDNRPPQVYRPPSTPRK